MNDREERSRLSGRVGRYARVGAGLGGAAAGVAARRLVGAVAGGDASALNQRDAEALKSALGGLKGPLMKAAQIMATVPDLLPPEFAEELGSLQSAAPPMGPGFVRRRMAAELGPAWKGEFREFEQEAAAAASLGQVHRATHKDGRALACKLQYPDMRSAIDADIDQLKLALSIFKRIEPSIDTSAVQEELTERLREELDYKREAAHMRLYRSILGDTGTVHVPEPIEALSTGRLLTMTWISGDKLLAFKGRSQEERNTIAVNLFHAWWRPFTRHAVIHGDPHLGNYTVRPDDLSINLLDYGCVRVFDAKFATGVVDLYRAIRADDRDAIVAAYEVWGFKGLSNDLIETLSVWAKFIYGPILDDRTRTVADGIAPAEYGRREAFEVRERLKKYGPVTIPREFVLMDRAAIGLGSVFLHLDAELNFHRLFEAEIEGVEETALRERQARALADAEVPIAA
ncbi:MAG: AarF/ABC1/UbiB kinase family protein [Pseudomonadota bacterium]